MARLNYTVITVSAKEVKHVANNICFDSREYAERYAEGLTVGAAMAGKKYGVIMLLNGVDHIGTTISKNMDYKRMQNYFRGYLWPKQEAGGLNHYWELTNEPGQLPVLPEQIEIAI